MGRFRGLHVVAGIAAMLVAAFLGSAMKLNNTAVVMSSCVVFVAVAMWADSALTRRRRASVTLQQAASLEQATSLEPAATLEPRRETGPALHQGIAQQSSLDRPGQGNQPAVGNDTSGLDSSVLGRPPGEPPKREGNAA
ncbi:hypothetical protein J7E83_16250 [Arthrobacter sp. ISL-48]|uniref:hypothetical protein n=1 Tax=Arthrobacter sp. ISL-48 TaxID=2819110 RepID=UPI001BEAF237|nr:hypothetical protein [Arthrobacter sp. ISL-48]MBT2533646.1 hypothetical protein [Arthrobacter sp. ISL-48]